MVFSLAPDDRMESRSNGGAAAGVAELPVLASGRLLGGRYRLERALGRGGMAAVWLATDERLDRAVAVKVLSDTLAGDREYLTRFGREARVAAQLQHPNLVAIYDFGAGERPYLVMEYVDGGDLRERLEAGDAPAAEPLAAELLSALRHIHSAGVLHRDIKPQNVLVDAEGHARLTDFGIAQPADATSLTRTGEVIGTERYLAPEVMAGEPASERSDLYALGVVLDEAAGATATPGMRSLVSRLTDPDPAARPRSAAAALALLERASSAPIDATATRPIEAPPLPPADTRSGARSFEPTPAAPAGAPWWRRNLAGIAAIAALAVALVIGLAIAAGGEEGGSGGSGDSSREASADKPEKESAPDAPAPAPPEEPAGAAAVSDGGGGAVPEGTDGYALNEQGFALNRQERFDEAVPVLEQAVDALRASGDETTLNYALFNLGVAYLGAGRPDDAIPVLEERMRFNDGQLGEVQAQLDRAYAEAGVEPPGGSRDQVGSKAGGPPPWAEND